MTYLMMDGNLLKPNASESVRLYGHISCRATDMPKHVLLIDTRQTFYFAK
jgi:hypothetical protein